MTSTTVITHVISGDLWAGAENQVLQLTIGLRKSQAIKVTAVLFNNGVLAAKLRELDNVTDKHLFNAARVYSLCAASIKAANGERLTAEQTQQRQTWINEAVATLKRSIDAGWDDWASLEKNSDLDAIRQDAEYRELIRQRKPPAKSADNE